MTDTQLYFAIGIPSALFALNFLAVLATGFWQAKRFDDMKELFKAEINSVRAEVNSVRSEVNSVRAEVSGIRSELRSEVGGLRSELRSGIASLRSDIQGVEATLTSELKRVEGVLSAKIDGLGVRVKALENEIHTPLVKQ